MAKIQRTDRDTLRIELQGFFSKGIRETIDWFRGQMADYYYQVTTRKERRRHIEILHAMRCMRDTRLTMVDDKDSGKVLFFGHPGPSMLTECLHLLGDQEFHRLELHTARDHSLCIFAFVYRSEEVLPGVDMVAHRQAIVEASCTDEFCLARHVVHRYLDSVDDGYLSRSYPGRVARHILAWSSLTDPEGLHVDVDDHKEGQASVTRALVAGQFNRQTFIQNLADFLVQYDLFLERGYLDLIPAYTGDGDILVTTLYLTDNRRRQLGKRQKQHIIAGLQGLRRYFTGKLRQTFVGLSMDQRAFEVLAASIDFSAQILAADHPFLDVREVGRDAMASEPALSAEMAGLIDARFGEKSISRRAFDRRVVKLRERINDLGTAAMVTVMETMLDFITAIQATNIFREERLGQSFKIDPSVLPESQFPHRPYGVFFFHGNHGVGFQVRFRASARGGLRLLLPRTNVQLSRSRDNLLREVYDLAWAQQLKNKDIPEGGSKCIALVRPEADADDMVKLLTDSLLDLILPAGKEPDIRGPHGEEREDELIFLGPDENMTPDRIVWVAQRAEFRGYKRHLTLMSSKPGAGINHKEYGVTSEGVFCWVPHVLASIGIPETGPYTLKMTGGPDGDVGGNLINILHREHKDRCRIVAISDGTGCAYDPDGLAWKELLRLFEEGLGIAAFNAKHLRGSDAHVTKVTDRASEDIRNNLHNRVVTDLFVPCGGRPYTINERNWEDFLTEDGKPSARGMIEGANIFITADARDELQRKGMISIKDSSANKGGVICSSYEILAGLVMDEKEFKKVKKSYVTQTVNLLRYYAEEEADAVLGAWRRRRESVLLSDLSMQFSQEINRISGLLIGVISQLLDDKAWVATWRRELEAHCPPVLVKKFGDRLEETIPAEHRIALLAKRYASRMLYREGLTWCRNYVVADNIETVFTAYLESSEEALDIGTALGKRQQQFPVEAVVDGTRRELVRRRLGI